MKYLICALISLSAVNVLAKDLPSYITQCSLKEADLNGCIRDNGNKAIPVIVKGDPDLGIPSLSPITVKELVLGGDNLKIMVTDAYCDDLKTTKLTETLFDLKNQKAGYTAVIDSLTVTGKYSIKDGKILDLI
ncbi:hemolymph juvenile hormone binding protein (JHBP) [Popillia japonica]|uniref:Hemolymph juvenile hormone binding protein (JHBP) n=1 Tax=Popillia japonica TaxID=7064 RepID=A0AAW1IAQ8_POPJA